MSRIAVVLFNLGGPDGPEAVRPFLRNLFADPAIIRLPGPARLAAAELVSRLRERTAKANYAAMGGASPLNRETEVQARALESALIAQRPADEVRVFVAMRYWKPTVETVARAVAAFAPDETVLLPLYPQFSTTTTASSLEAWRSAYRGGGRQHAVCCYYDDPGLVAAHAGRIGEAWEAAGTPRDVRLLFSAHGLPESISSAGDPYRWQIERTSAAVAAALGPGWDWRVCYQSRVGPLKWIGPSTLEEIAAAGREGMGVLVAPIAFVSEHVETLIELDRDYAAAAGRAGAAPYLRAAALGDHPAFITALARIAVAALSHEGVAPGADACRPGCGRCPLQAREAA